MSDEKSEMNDGDNLSSKEEEEDINEAPGGPRYTHLKKKESFRANGLYEK
jgi:hypothetical protein